MCVRGMADRSFCGGHSDEAEPIGNTQEQMAQQIKAETEKFAKRVKQAHVVIE